MSHDKGFHFLEKKSPTRLIKDGLLLNGKGAGILGTFVSIANTDSFLDQEVPTLIIRKQGRFLTYDGRSINNPSKHYPTPPPTSPPPPSSPPHNNYRYPTTITTTPSIITTTHSTTITHNTTINPNTTKIAATTSTYKHPTIHYYYYNSSSYYFGVRCARPGESEDTISPKTPTPHTQPMEGRKR